ncbi:mCG1039017 [Mus musculus]|nr:mCG1039017 [Mus musculus]
METLMEGRSWYQEWFWRNRSVRMNLLHIWNGLHNLSSPANSPVPSTTETSPDTLSWELGE